MSKAVHDMFASISRSYDRGNDVLSFGVHRLWRRSSLSFAGLHAKHPAKVLDLCCGTGDYSIALRKHLHQDSHVIGLDFVFSMVQLAVRKGKKLKGHYPDGNKPFEVIQGDALNLPFRKSSFDACVIGFGIRNVDDYEFCLRKIHEVLKSGGTLVVLEFGSPESRFVRPFFTLYSKFIMPFLGGLVSGNREAYRYLPETSLKFPCGKSFCDRMVKSGFKDVKYRTYFGGIAYAYAGRK